MGAGSGQRVGIGAPHRHCRPIVAAGAGASAGKMQLNHG